MNNYQNDLISCIPRLNSYALHLTKDEEIAKDLVQDVLIKGILNEDKFTKGTDLKAWLCKIMYFTFVDYTRLGNKYDPKKRYSFEENIEVINKKVDYNLAISNLNIEVINKLINNLSYKPKECFILRSKGFKYGDIAKRLNIPLGSVKSNLNVAKTELKQQLKLLGYE